MNQNNQSIHLSLRKLFFALIYAVFSLFATNPMHAKDKEIIIDSKMTFEEAIAGKTIPVDVKDSLCLIDVKYYSFDGKVHQGQLIMNKAVKKDIQEIFEIILKEKFPIAHIIPICKYGWDDDSSMSANNCSSFNYRNIAGTNRLSKHALGMAIDINPFYNPVVYKDGSIIPKGAKYISRRKGTFNINHVIVKAFKERGWRWGGEFSSYKDNHHFDKG